jgi:hypothetical protein
VRHSKSSRGKWSDRLHVMGMLQQFVLLRIESPCLKRSTALFPQPFHRRWREHHVERLYRVVMDVQRMRHTDWIAGLERRQMPLSILRSRLHAGAQSPLETRRSPSPGATKSARKDSVITQRFCDSGNFSLLNAFQLDRCVLGSR